MSATTPELNTTNNLATEGIVVRRPRPVVDVAVAAPPLGHVGDALRYRVRMRAGGRAGARFVRLCHRPPPGLLVTDAPGTVRRSGRLCRDVDRLRRGAGAGFTVTVTPAARTAGRTLRLRARATAPGLRSARGADRVAVAGRSYVGTG